MFLLVTGAGRPKDPMVLALNRYRHAMITVCQSVHTQPVTNGRKRWKLNTYWVNGKQPSDLIKGLEKAALFDVNSTACQLFWSTMERLNGSNSPKAVLLCISSLHTNSLNKNWKSFIIFLITFKSLKVDEILKCFHSLLWFKDVS